MTIIHRNLRDNGERNEYIPGSDSRQDAPCYDTVDSGEEDLGCWRPAVDIINEKDDVKLLVELPGLAKDDITINVENGILSISGERKAPSDAEKSKFVRSERCFGGFCRSFSIGNQINTEQIEATMDKGMLTLTLPFREESKPKIIEVKIGG